jgi:hypothetical protein
VFAAPLPGWPLRGGPAAFQGAYVSHNCNPCTSDPVVWQIESDGTGGFSLIDEHDRPRGEYGSGESVAAHLALALQEIERLKSKLKLLKHDERSVP